MPPRRYDAILCQRSDANISQMIHNIPQPEFEHFIAKELARDPNVEIRKGVAFVSCHQVCEMSLVYIVQ
jgi:hypothetical protein